MLVDRDGRFRIVTSSKRFRYRLDRGSRRFLVCQAGGLTLRIVQAFVTGTAPPFGVHVRVAFDGPAGPDRRDDDLANAPTPPGARPDPAVAAYWLGPAWMGHRARSSSAASGHGGWYSIAYPHVDVEVDDPARGLRRTRQR